MLGRRRRRRGPAAGPVAFAGSPKAAGSGIGDTEDRAEGETLMGILTWIVLGLVAGLLTNFLMGGKGSTGLVITTLLGIAGALVGGYVGSHVFGTGDVSGFD